MANALCTTAREAAGEEQLVISSSIESLTQKLEREEEAVRKIAELYGQMFSNTRFELFATYGFAVSGDGIMQMEPRACRRSEGGG